MGEGKKIGRISLHPLPSPSLPSSSFQGRLVYPSESRRSDFLLFLQLYVGVLALFTQNKTQEGAQAA
jgi:hypothetical protein